MNENHDAYDQARLLNEYEAKLQSLDWDSKQRVHDTIDVIERMIAAINKTICSFDQFRWHAQDFKRELESQKQELYDIVSPS